MNNFSSQVVYEKRGHMKKISQYSLLEHNSALGASGVQDFREAYEEKFLKCPLECRHFYPASHIPSFRE